MGRYLGLPLLLIAVILQATIVPEIRIGDGGPDLVLLLVVSWGLLAGLGEGFLWAMIGGILQDLINGFPIGTTAFGLVVMIFVINTIFHTTGRFNVIIPPVAVLLGTGLYQAVLIILLTLLGKPVPIGYTLLNITLPAMIYNVVLVLPIFRALGFIHAASQPKRVTLN